MFRNLAILFSVAAVPLAVACGTEAGTDNTYRPETLVSEVECAEMIAQLAVPVEVARAMVPSDYEVVGSSGGTANLVFITKVCHWDNPDPLGDADTQEAHFYIQIEGEGKVIEVPGADVNVPASYGYNVALDAKGPSWLRDLLNSYGYDIREPSEMDIGPAGDERKGYVVEENGSGYRWTEYAALIGETILVGETSYFYHDSDDGTKAKTEKSALSHHDSVGWVTLEIDPGSRLAEFGTLLDGPTMNMNPMYATYTTWSE